MIHRNNSSLLAGKSGIFTHNFDQRNTGFGLYLVVFLGEMVDFDGDFIADGLGDGFAIDYGGLVL